MRREHSVSEGRLGSTLSSKAPTAFSGSLFSSLKLVLLDVLEFPFIRQGHTFPDFSDTAGASMDGTASVHRWFCVQRQVSDILWSRI